MFPLGHIGITVGVVYVLASLFSSRQGRDNQNVSLVGDIDFRIVIIASMVPDIIDKIVGMVILKEQISNGRIFTHSIVIIGIISICLFLIDRKRFGPSLKPLFYISPLWIHLFLDSMWEDPYTLFWPLFGTSFPRLDMEIGDFFTILLTEPYVYLTEILGTLIITILFIRHRLFIKTRFLSFLKDGKLKIFSNS